MLKFQTNINDITPQFAATGMAIGNTFGSIMGFIAPAASGHMLSNYGKVLPSFTNFLQGAWKEPDRKESDKTLPADDIEKS